MEIGANIKYEGRKFLDDRSGLANTLQDLLEWSILIPEGFEVYVTGVEDWYTYKGEDYWDEITGHFQRRIDNEEINATLKDHEDSIIELMEATFPISYSSFTGGGNYEVGSNQTVVLTWTIQRKGVTLTPTKVIITKKSGSTTTSITLEGEDVNLNKYTDPYQVTTNTSYTVTSYYDKLKVSKTANCAFYYKKYYGVFSTEYINNSDILSLSSAWATSYSLASTQFNCTGGKYIYYVLPYDVYPGSNVSEDPDENESELAFWVGGLKNTDLIVYSMGLTNSSGSTKKYVVVRLNNKQTGKLTVEITKI